MANKRDKEKLRPPPLRWGWLQLMPPDTRGKVDVHPRLFWKGVANDDSDPLLLAGMELCLAWSPVEDDRSREYVVSAIVLKSFLAQYVHPLRSSITVYDYAVDLLQAVDPSTEYGKLLANQRFRGLDDGNADVTVRSLRMRLFIGNPDKGSRQLFRSRTKCGRFPQGVELPSNTILQPPILLPEDCEIAEDGNPVATAAGTPEAPLSNLEVDRMWELTGFVAEWLLDRQGNHRKRLKRREECRGKVEAARAAEVGPRAEVERLLAELESARTLETQRTTELELARKLYKESETAGQRELSIATAAVRSAENEIRRLEGVYKKEFRLLVEAYQQHGEGSPQHVTATERTTKAKANWDATPAKLEAVKRAIPPIEARLRARERQLSGPVQFAESQLKAAQAQVQKLSAEHTAAVETLKALTTATTLVVNEADEYANSV